MNYFNKFKKVCWNKMKNFDVLGNFCFFKKTENNSNKKNAAKKRNRAYFLP